METYLLLPKCWEIFVLPGKQILFPQQCFPRWTNRETFAGNIMFLQQCFLVCSGLKNYHLHILSLGIFCPVSKISKPKTQTRQKARPNSAKLHTNLARVVHVKHTAGGSLPGSRSTSRSSSPQPETKQEDNNNIKV